MEAVVFGREFTGERRVKMFKQNGIAPQSKAMQIYGVFLAIFALIVFCAGVWLLFWEGYQQFY